MEKPFTAKEHLVSSLKEVRTVAVNALEGQSPDDGDRQIVLMAWWNRVGKDLFQQVHEGETTEVIDDLEKIFPGISKIILSSVSIEINGKQFQISEAGLSKQGNNEIAVPVYQDGTPNSDGLAWMASGYYEGAGYFFLLKGSFNGEPEQTLSFDYEDPMVIQILDTIDPIE